MCNKITVTGSLCFVFVFQALCVVLCQCVKVVAVRIDEEAGEEAVGPARICK